MVPSLLGMCAIFFWVATKVHTHNALFVYCQRFEGGGKIFFYWNRIIFIILYSAIIVFSLFLALKEFRSLAVGFFFTMIVITYCVSKSIESTFVIHSQHLPISIARIHDEEEVSKFRTINDQLHFQGPPSQLSLQHYVSCEERLPFLEILKCNVMEGRISCIVIQY
jgi:hypothetical protein